MQIEIDFEVFKALTALRKSEADSYNGVIRELLNLPSTGHEPEPVCTVDDLIHGTRQIPVNILQLLAKSPKSSVGTKHGNFLNSLFEGGAWYGNTHFPDGTLFRATYKGQTYSGEIREGRWVDQDGFVRTSPSDAANAISSTNVNGWRFWYAKRPSDEDWVKMEELKR